MKLVAYESSNGARIGLVVGDRLVDVTGAGLTGGMIDLIERFPALRDELDRLPQTGASQPLSEVKLLPPLIPPRNIFCVGKNYYEHAAEFGSSGFDSGSIGGSEIPEYPIIFTKPPSAVIGPNAPIESALDPYDSVDYEAELAVVIGKRGRVAESDDPMSFVFGYTIMNDVTSRELQKRHKQWDLGKGIDTFAPLGPAIVTIDEMSDLSKHRIELWVNEEQRQSASLADLIFDVPTLVRAIGRSITLQPGDIIATGTPVGVGIGFKPPRYLKPGDRVRIDVSGLGSLENPIN